MQVLTPFQMKPIYKIKRGMTVCDMNGETFGFVASVFRGKGEKGADKVAKENLKVTMQRFMQCTRDFPLAVYARFYRDGFVAVRNASQTWYFIPQQIYAIRGKYIYLRVSKNDLLSDRN